MQCQKSEALKLWVGTSFPKRIQVCVGEDLAFLIVDLTFQGQWICFKFHASHEAVVVLLVLEATLVLLTAQVPVLKL